MKEKKVYESNALCQHTIIIHIERNNEQPKKSLSIAQSSSSLICYEMNECEEKNPNAIFISIRFFSRLKELNFTAYL